jgi:AcrR family transcriptional regulator
VYTPPMSRVDLDAVVETAIVLADEAGLEAVSLRRLAERFGLTPMALYRYIKSKDELLDAMADRLYAELEFPADDADWWEGLACLARSTRKVLLAHAWARPLFARPLAGPHARALADALDDLLRRAGFSASESGELHDQLTNMVFALVAPELSGKRNRAAFERGLEMLHAGLVARQKSRGQARRPRETAT